MRRYLYIVLPLLLLISSSGMVKAQGTPEEVTEHFFELFRSKGSDAAVDYMFSTNKWLNSDSSNVKTIKVNLKRGVAILGQYYGYELIEKKSYGESYVQLSYMLRYDRQPVKFVFILYKPNNTWQIQNMKPVDRIEEDPETPPK
jgi:hypothetical protein